MASNILQKLKSGELFGLKGYTAVVTGASQGIGLSIARGFAYAGARVSIVDINMEEATKQSEILNEELNATVSIPIHADVTKKCNIDHMIDTTVKEFGRMDIAFNNAGMVISGEDNDTQHVSEEDYDRQMDLNVKAVFQCCQREGEYMISNGIKGRIINTASMSSFVVNFPQKQSVYNLSKAAVVQMTRSLAVEWAPHGIRVNCISPGYTLTPLTQQPELADMRQMFSDGAPMKRMCDPDELIGAAIYLASDASTFTTGIELLVTGGFDLW